MRTHLKKTPGLKWQAPKKWVLITGPTSGLGRELSFIFADNGHGCVLVSRNRDALDALADELAARYLTESVVIAADLTESEAPAAIFRQTESLGLEIDVLINNSGIGSFGMIHENDIDEELRLIDLNVRSLVALTRLYVSGMVKRDRGGILNIGSIAGFQPVPLLANYAASKAYVNSFTQSLAWELRKTGVTVSLLCPGPFESGFKDAARMRDSKNFAGRMMRVSDIAMAAYLGFMKKRRIIFPDAKDGLMVFLQRLVPRGTTISVAASKVDYL